MKRPLLTILFLLIVASCASAQVTTQNARRIRSGTGAPSGACVVGGPYTDVYINVSDHSVYECTGASTWTKVVGGGTPGTVTSVSGTTNQVDVATGTTTPVISLSATVVAPGTVTATTSVASPFFKSTAADPADAGVVRLGNNELIEWEKATPGTDWTLGVNASDVLVSSAPISAPSLTLTTTPLAAGSGGTGISALGTGVPTALGINIGSAGAPVVNGGVLGTPSSGTLTNATGLPTTGLTGTLQAAQEPAHTGDVTNSAGSLALTIANNAVTLAKLATQATNTVLGNATSGTAVPTALSVGSCSTAGSALIWTTNTGFGCNTSITAAAVPAAGVTAGTFGTGAYVMDTSLTNPILIGGTGTTSTLKLRPTSNSGGTTGADIIFQSGNNGATETARILNNGQVGVGTTTPGSWASYSETKHVIHVTDATTVSRFIAEGVGGSNLILLDSTASANIKWVDIFHTADSVSLRSVNDDGLAVNKTIWSAVPSTGGFSFSSGLTTAAGTPGSLCYNTSTFEVLKNNALTCTVSSRDYKTDIKPLGPTAFDKLRPVQFAYTDQPLRSRYGFIAEEAAGADRRFADGYDANGIPRSLDQNAILSATVEEVQHLKAIVALQQKEIDELKARPKQ